MGFGQKEMWKVKNYSSTFGKDLVYLYHVDSENADTTVEYKFNNKLDAEKAASLLNEQEKEFERKLKENV